MNNTQKALLVVLAVSVLGGKLTSFLLGIHPFFFVLLFVGFRLLQVSFLVSILCLIVSIWSAIQRKPYAGFTATWITLFAITKVVGVCFGMAGSLVVLHLAGPEQVVAEGRDMMASPDEVVGELHRSEDYPPAIKRLHPDVIYVFRERTNIRKFGLGDFAGFVIYPDGEDPGEPAEVGICRWLKIREGLYWFADG